MNTLSKWTVTLAAAGVCGAVMAESVMVPPELWDRPRTGRIVLEQPAIRQVVKTHLEKKESRIVVHHGPTPESRMLAEELRAWLMALALESSQVTLRNDLGLAEPLRIEVREKGN